MKTSIETKKPFWGEASNDVQLLVERLQKVGVGETATYRELSQLVGRDVRIHRHLIDSARRILLRDHNLVFRSVVNEGYKRLDDAEVVDTVTTDRKKRIRRQAKYAVRELSSVKYDCLDKQRQINHNAGMAMFGVMIQATDKSSIKRLQEKVANAGGKIDVKGTLQLIGWIAED